MRGTRPRPQATVSATRRTRCVAALAAAALAGPLLACTTPLVDAAQHGNLRKVDALLASPAPEARQHMTEALFRAAERGHVEVCERLLDAGADVDERDNQRQTPLIAAARHGHPDVAARLIARGADVDARDAQGSTPLHWSADSRSPEVTRVLLAAGASPNPRDDDLATPLYIATDRRQAEVVAKLLEYGADPNLPDRNGRTPLLEACDDGRVEMARRLLAAGAKPDIGDHDARTPLVHAIEDRQQELVGLLVAAGANPNQVDRDGDPAAVMAVERESDEILRMLLEAGADPDARARDGRRAIHIARSKQDTRAVALLLAHGADPQTWATELSAQLGDPLAYAAQHGYLALARAYVENSAAIAAGATRTSLQAAGVGYAPGAASTSPPAPGRSPAPLAARPSPDRTAGPERTATPGGELYSRRIAVVIGIDDYQGWPALEGAESDAHRVARTFRERGFDEVIELYGSQATRTQIMTTLGLLSNKTDRDALAVIYFAGHGETETLPSGEKRGYIIPVDGQPRHIYATAIEMSTLRELSDRLPAKQVYYAMDSCYSGLGLSRGIAPMDRSKPDYITKLASKRAVQMITAGAENEQVVERGSRGLFTTYFLRALAGEADFDDDGWVTASEIGTWVKPQVSNASENQQTPQFGSLLGTGEVVFRTSTD